jgi:ribosomal protein L11 methylase PrmA
LSAALIREGLIVGFQDAPKTGLEGDNSVYKIIEPDFIPFISYPYEWSFSMLQSAALLTLKIQQVALAHGMSLKDASSYNIQFLNGKAIFIDTLSFEFYTVGETWVAYRQFCQHFIAPLSLMAAIKPELVRLLSIYIDGLPLDVAWAMLPLGAKWNLGYYMHLNLHAKAQVKHENSNTQISAAQKTAFTQKAFGFLLHNLEKTVSQITLPNIKSEWSDYTHKTVHAADYTLAKTQIINTWLMQIKPKTVWDLGANTGTYSKLAAKNGAKVVAFDGDARCIEQLFLAFRESGEHNILPLFMDLANPSPALGWAHTERDAWANRPKPELLFALALVHHLAISNQLPFEQIATFFAKLTPFLIVEFVPRTDPKVLKLLLNRRDTAAHYTQIAFEKAFTAHFNIIAQTTLPPDGRILFLMQKID